MSATMIAGIVFGFALVGIIMWLFALAGWMDSGSR